MSNGFEVSLECELGIVDESSKMIMVSKTNQFKYINISHIYEITKDDYLFM